MSEDGVLPLLWNTHGYKESRPRGPGFELPPEGVLGSFLHAKVCWSNGELTINPDLVHRRSRYAGKDQVSEIQ